jgi:hypothetical protein
VLFRMIIALASAFFVEARTNWCSSGPKVPDQTHARGSETIRRVDEKQPQGNIGHIRYNETPFKLAASSVAAPYELAGAAEVHSVSLAPNPRSASFRTFTSVMTDVAVSRPFPTMPAGR